MIRVGLLTYLELILSFISAAVIGKSRAMNLSSLRLGEVERLLLSLLSLLGVPDYKYSEVRDDLTAVLV